MSKEIYLGPVVRVKRNIVNNEEKFPTCPKEDCKNHMMPLRKSNFCNECGEPVELRGQTIKGYIGWHEVCDAKCHNVDRLVSLQSEVNLYGCDELLLTNFKSFYKEGYQNINMEKVDIKSAISGFKKMFKVELEMLDEFDIEYEVGYDLVIYYY